MNTDPGATGLLWLWATVASLGPGGSQTLRSAGTGPASAGAGARGDHEFPGAACRGRSW